MCREYKIPHSVFLSWSAHDRDKAIWMHLRERDRCGACGTRREEWDESVGGDRHAYHADLQRCPGCEQVEQRRSHHKREVDNGVEFGHGVHIVLKPTR